MASKRGDLLTANERTLMKNLKSLVNSQVMSDVTFLVGDDKRKMYGHKCILAARCEVFRAMFEEQGSKDHSPIPIPDIQPLTFISLLDYLYTGQFYANSETLVELIGCAIEYGLDEMKNLCVDHVYNILSAENACEFLQASISYHLEEMQANCMEFVEKHTAAVFRSKSFPEITEAALECILRSSDLDADEMDVLNAVRAWANVQSVVSDKPLQHVVKTVIELVRFPLLSSDELSTVEEDNEKTRYIPLRLISDAWKYHALKNPDPKNLQQTPRAGTRRR